MIASASAIALLLSSATAASPPKAACAGAVVLVAQTATPGHQIYVDGVTTQSIHDLLDRWDLALGWQGRAPSPELLSGLRIAQPRSALECSEARRLADARGDIASEAASKQVLASRGLRGTPTTVNWITLPILDEHKLEALAVVMSSNNQGVGGGWLVLLAKDLAGRWTEVGRRQLYIA